MHMVIRAVVYAVDKDDALSRAETIFENMCGEGGVFDYYVMFNQDGSGVAGKDRWGNLPAVVEADSKRGKELIEEGIKYSEQEFIEALKHIREEINKEDEELMDLGMFRYWCHVAGAYSGASVFLYDNDGEGIRDRKHLENVLNKWNSKEYENLKIFVVPADVHH